MTTETPAKPLWAVEFPDFPEAEMPTIPEGFEDTSWGNEMSPGFYSAALGLKLWVDRVDPAEREMPELSRFTIYECDEDEAPKNMEPLETDDWALVLAKIERARQAVSR